MRPPDLNIVHLTPARLALWGRPQASPAFLRSPAPWLSSTSTRQAPPPAMPAALSNPYAPKMRGTMATAAAPGDLSKQQEAAGFREPYVHVEPILQPPPPEYILDEEQRDAVLFSERKRAVQEFFSELFGTFVMILFGDGVVAQVVLSKGTQGDAQSINWAWGVAVMIGAFVAKKSGGHLNPAVTLAHCVFRRFPWRKFPVYFFAQLLGALLGALVVYANYTAAIDLLEGGRGVRTVLPGVPGAGSTASIFATYPVPFLSTWAKFFSEFLCSAILMFCVFSIVDAGLGNLTPLFLLFLVFGIGASFGWQTGYAMNLARDFGPRLACVLFGYGDAVFTAGNTYFWIPLVAPFMGTLFGGLLYDIFIYQGDISPINPPWTRPSEPV